jgi:hypothetical protein
MKTEADRKAGANKHVSAVLAGASLYLVSAPVFQHLFLIGALLSVCVTLAKSWPGSIPDWSSSYWGSLYSGGKKLA